MTKIIEYEEVESEQPEAFRFSKEEYLGLFRLGILPANLKTELINGEIIRQMSKGELHSGLVGLIMTYLIKQYPNDEFTFRPEGPVDLPGSSIPEPDLAVCVYQTAAYTKEYPNEKSTLLIIEIANTSLGYVRGRKKEIYAKAGIPEYWIVNLVDDQVEVHHTPNVNRGEYEHRTIVHREGRIKSNLLGDHPVERFLAP